MLQDPILTPILDAFAKIELKDLRVGSVVLDEKIFTTLTTKKHYLEKNMGYFPDNFYNFQLWGVPIIKSNNENMAYSEYGFTRSCSVEINFNSILFKKYYIIVHSRADIIKGVPKNELCAIDTLREMITEAEYRRYMIHSFITVPVPSGKIYQIFRNSQHIKVWQKGVLVEELCIYLKDSKIPPTDKVIALKTMLETDEEDTRKLGNLYKITNRAA